MYSLCNMIPMVYGALHALIVLDLIGCTLIETAQWRAANSIVFPNLLELFDPEKTAGTDASLKRVNKINK